MTVVFEQVSFTSDDQVVLDDIGVTLIDIGAQTAVPREVWGLHRGRVRRYLTCMRTRVSSKGQIVLPAELRQRDRIETGQEFDVERVDRGEYRLVRRIPSPNAGVIDWLLACPEKDFFVPIESESTDTL